MQLVAMWSSTAYVVDLVDTPAENGSFECLDGFHRRLDSWLDTLPEGTQSITQAMNDEFHGQAFRVGASAGDLVIWDTRLPHGRSINRGDKPRVVQYISMFPPPADVNAQRPRPRGHVHDNVPAIEIGAYEYRRRWYDECTGSLKSLEGAPSGRSKPALLSGKLAWRLAGLEEWPVEEAPPVEAYASASGMPPWESENLAPLISRGQGRVAQGSEGSSAADRLREFAAEVRAKRAEREATTFTREQLLEYDGTDGKPIYMACLGDVFDVTPGEGFYGKRGPYGCFAGRDASRGLAMMRKDQRFIDDPRIDLLTPKQLKVAKDWHSRFAKKYKKMGTMAPANAPCLDRPKL